MQDALSEREMTIERLEKVYIEPKPHCTLA